MILILCEDSPTSLGDNAFEGFLLSGLSRVLAQSPLFRLKVIPVGGNKKQMKWEELVDDLVSRGSLPPSVRSSTTSVFYLTDLFHNVWKVDDASTLRSSIMQDVAPKLLPVGFYAHVMVQELEALYLADPQLASKVFRLPMDHPLLVEHPEKINGADGTWGRLVKERPPVRMGQYAISRAIFSVLEAEKACSRCENFGLFWADLVRVARELQQEEGGAEA